MKALRSVSFSDAGVQPTANPSGSHGVAEPATGFSAIIAERAESLPPEDASLETSPGVARNALSRAYLPSNGALPLRYSAARDWPAPLPAAALALMDDASTAPVVEAVASAEADIPEEAAQVAAERSEDRSPPKPAVAALPRHPDPRAVLTADMVLGYMSDLVGETAGLNARFLPAMPGEAKNSTTLAALRP